nr:hypothetical transcript [Hymenolepis microstoma]
MILTPFEPPKIIMENVNATLLGQMECILKSPELNSALDYLREWKCINESPTLQFLVRKLLECQIDSVSLANTASFPYFDKFPRQSNNWATSIAYYFGDWNLNLQNQPISFMMEGDHFTAPNNL